MEIFDVFSKNEIENNPASGEIFLENVILKVSQTHFPRISIPRGGAMPPAPPPLGLAKGGINFSRGGGAMLVCKIPLLARRTRPSARATIGYLVYKGNAPLGGA